MKTPLPYCLCAAALALSACGNQDSSNGTAATQPSEASDAAGDKTIAAAVDQNSKFFQAAKSVGLDATLAGPGPYTVLVPGDDAFAGIKDGALGDTANPQNRAEITRVLTYHILPGVVLADDISKAIDNGKGSTVLATMGGETLTATKEGGNIVLTDSAGNKATVGQADEQASNGVIHRIDKVLMPGTPGQAPPQQGQ